MNLWYEYLDVWSTHRALAVAFVLACAVVVLAIISTFSHGLLAVLFIPGLAALYGHHLLVKKLARQ